MDDNRIRVIDEEILKLEQSEKEISADIWNLKRERAEIKTGFRHGETVICNGVCGILVFNGSEHHPWDWRRIKKDGTLMAQTGLYKKFEKVHKEGGN